MQKIQKRSFKYIGVIIFIIILAMPLPTGLNPAGKKALAVFALSLSFWLSQALPLAVTALLGISLLPLLGALDLNHTFSLFGNKAIFFILGALILAAGLYQTGLGSRIAFYIIKSAGKSPRKLLVGILFSAGLLSCLMPEHAVAALLFPVILEIAGSLNIKPLESNYGKLLFLTMAWGTVIGGITTYLGGARNLLAVGLLEANYGITIGFFEWVKYAWPLPFLMLGIYALLINYYFKIDIENIEEAYQTLKDKQQKAGQLNLREKKLTIILFAVIFSWLFLANYINIAVTALLGGVIMVAAGVIEWQEIEEYVNWGVIVMYGGAIVIASSLVETGVTEWLAQSFFADLKLPGLLFVIFIALFTSILTEGVSNVAAVAVILPLSFSVAEAYQLNPVMITLTVALSGGLAFLLPMGTPPNAIAYAAGYYRIQDAVKWGLFLKIIGWFIYILLVKFYWPMVGLEIYI